MATYRYLVGDLVPSSGNGIREEMPFSKVKYSHALNAPGGFTASIGHRHPKATRLNLDPGRTAIHLERDGVIIWSGILWTARAGVKAGTLDVGGEGWWSYFRRRRIRTGTGGPSPSTATARIYTAQDQLFIARDLVNYAQGQSGGNIGVTVGTELTTDNGGVQRLRDRTFYAYERKPVGEAVEQLAAVQNGFDFAIDVAYDGTGTIIKTLRFGYPRRGRVTDVVWELGANLEDLTQAVDASRQANLVDALGAGDADAMLIATAADTSQIGPYPLLEDTISLKDITVDATLQAHANSELRTRARPIATIPTLLARPTAPDTTLGSFITGDSLTVRGADGWISVDERMRIMSWEVSVDENGKETVAVAFAQEDASAG